MPIPSAPVEGNSSFPELDELTRRRLLEFGRRREQLLWWRGLLGALAATLGALMVATAADAAWVLEDWVRMALSLSAWALGAFELWRLTLRHLRGRRDLARLARWFEAARPDLREEVLSAVELGTRPPPSPGLDSPVFRARLQAVVAERLATIEPERLLPWSLVRRWLLPAAVAFVLVAMFLGWPGLHGAHRLMRAALPTANLARVARTRLEVREPSPPDATVPIGDAVPVVVEASGRRITEAWIETAAAGRRARARMKPIGPARYAASLETTDADLLYRIRGGDAVTRWYRISAVPPPRITAFEKTYHPPAWLGRPAQTVRETSGDLEGVEGTRVDLRIESDQPLARSELRFDLEGESLTVPLEREDPLHWRVSFDLTRPGLYQAQLVAARSGFENRERPVWEIRVHPDQPPRVEIVEPAADRTATPDDLLRWSVDAADDYGLVALQRRVQIRRAGAGWRNDGAPRACTGETAAVTETTDLLALGVRPGDEVWVKYVATDLRGQTGESSVRRLIIAAESFDPSRRSAADAWQRVREALAQLSGAAREARQAQSEARRTAQTASAPEAERAAARAHALSAIQAAERAAETVTEAIRQAQSALSQGPAADALERIATSVGAIRHAELAVARRLSSAAATPEAQNVAAEEAARRLDRAVERAEQTARTAHLVSAAEEAELALADVRDVRQELRRALEAPSESAADRERLARRQAAAAAHMNDIAERLAGVETKRSDFREAARTLSAAAAAARSDADAGSSPRLADLSGAADRAMNTLVPLAADLQREASEALQNLAEVHPRRDVLRRLAQDLEAATGTPSQDSARAEVLAHRRAALRDAAAALLRERATFEERRSDSDPAFVQDLQTAASAVRAVSAEAGREAARTVEQIADALRRLETAHDAHALTHSLHHLAADERWGEPDDRRSRARAQVWRAAENQLPRLESAFREQALPAAADAVGRVRSLPETARAREEMVYRSRAVAGRANVADEIRAAADAMSEAAQQAQAAATETRSWLAALAPSLPARFAAARDDVRRAREAAQSAVRADEAAARANIAHALQQQRNANEDLEDLRQLLRADAASQDLATPAGRERARDADDALAMLREPPPRAEDLLRAAAATPDAERRNAALEQAVAQQERLERALALLADHYQQLEQGSAEGRRTDLRAAEAEAGLAATMDHQYENAAAAAELARNPDALTPEALEQMLAANPAMQAALDRLSRAALRDAATAVRQAAEAEHRLAQRSAAAAGEVNRAREALRQQAQALAQEARKLAADALQPAARDASAVAPAAHPPLQEASGSATAAAEAAQTAAGEALHQAAASLANTAQQLRHAAGKAREAAGGAEQASRDAEARGETERASRGRDLAQRSEKAAARANELAGQAEALASQARAAAEAERAALAEGAAQQPGLIAQTDAAGAAAERAGRHQQRLGRNAGQAIAEAGRRTRATAAGELTQAREAIASAQAATAAPSLDTAAREATRRAEELETLATSLPPPMTVPADAGLDAAAAEWLARALDRADTTSVAAEAAARAARAQATAMAQARAHGLVPGEAPRTGAAAQAEGQPGPDAAPAPLPRVSDDWAKLPPDVARELRAARAEAVPEEYRAMVELYFKAIAREGRGEPK